MHTRSLGLMAGVLLGTLGTSSEIVSLGSAWAQQPAPAKLKKGDKAPAISVEDWVKGSKVEKFEQGKVYVVEFWATWCPPCRESIPHLTEVQKKYKDQGLTVLGVTSSQREKTHHEKLEAVNKFVKQQGDKMDYVVGLDDDRSMARDWMSAAGLTGIPSAFVVDATGTITFIGVGYPMDGFDDAVKAAVESAKKSKPKGSAAIDGRPVVMPVSYEQPTTSADKKDGKAADDDKPQKLERKPEAKAGPTLIIGDKAPELTVSKFVKGEPISGFEKGKTYVVEFWATWCPPCRDSIPHLTELQKKFKDVRFVGVSVWETNQEDVEPFVKDMGDKMGYAVAMDSIGGADTPASREGKMSTNWLKAAGQTAIPTAFIINGEGRIAWLGHPMGDLEESLQSIVEGKWDLDKKAAETRKAVDTMTRVRPLEKEFGMAANEEEWPKALAALDQLIELDPAALKYQTSKYEILMTKTHDFDKAYALGSSMVDGVAKDQSEALNEIAWLIVDPEGAVTKKDLKLAQRAGERAVELTKGEAPHILDTLAKVHFDSGNLSKAIELQEKAVQKVKGNEKYEMFEEEIANRLKEYKEAAKKKGGA